MFFAALGSSSEPTRSRDSRPTVVLIGLLVLIGVALMSYVAWGLLPHIPR